MAKSAKEQIYCKACKYPLPPNALFCPGCGPPHLPDDIDVEGLSTSQAILRIVLVVILFSIVVVYKYDLKFFDNLLSTLFSTVNAPKETTSLDSRQENAKVVYIVDKPQANVRESASMNGKVLVVLEKGQEVLVLQKKDSWSQIKVGNKIGWIYSKLLIAKVE